MRELGAIERVELREVWTDEAREFTPWVQENLQLLADALGIELQAEGREVAVGPFSADVLAVEPDSGSKVVIENQIGQTDHDHLGKLMTYAGGLGARFVVWIAGHFREEHRQALEWLNEITGPEIGFFGVEVELLRIDDSRPAPHFKVVSSPNELVKVVRGTVSERGLRYQAFWSALLELIKERDPGATAASPEAARTRQWFGIPVGRTGFRVNAVFAAGGRFLVELYIDTGDRGVNKQAFDALHERRVEIEGRFGEPLIWERLDHRRASRLKVERPGSIDGSEEELEELRRWAVQRMLKLRDTVAPHVRALSLELDELGEEVGEELDEDERGA